MHCHKISSVWARDPLSHAWICKRPVLEFLCCLYLSPLSMTIRTPTNVIDRRQLTYTTTTAIGRFNVNPPRLEASHVKKVTFDTRTRINV